MNLSDCAIEQFLAKLEANSNGSDSAGAVAQFADMFLAAGPDGSMLVRACDFGPALRKRKEIFTTAGCNRTMLLWSRATALDTRYSLIDTAWQMDFAPGGGAATEIRVSSTFLVDMKGEEPKILVYLAHQDVLRILEDRELLKN
jgi:hypothetical protein